MAAPSLTAPQHSRAPRPGAFRAKHALFLVFAVLSALVLVTRDLSLLDASSPLRQRYAPIPGLMLAHGVPGALALLLGVFQFSNRLRSRYLPIHRLMGRVYVGATFIAAPVAIPVAILLGDGSLIAASAIQAFGWILCTAIALYCVRNGNIQQHRQWMIRGYPFAVVFVVVRALLAIPAIQQTGKVGLDSVVWSVIALAAFLPSVLIAWPTFARKAVAPRAG